MSALPFAAADGDQIDDLIAQARLVAPRALTRGEISATKWASVDARLTVASSGDLVTVANALAPACTLLAPCPPSPRATCGTAARSKILLQRKSSPTRNADKLNWSWTKGSAIIPGDLDDPTTGTDYACPLRARGVGADDREARRAAARGGTRA